MRTRSVLLLLSQFLAPTAFSQLALYDAGPAGNPVVAPDPQTQGWSLQHAGGAGVSFTPISPDPGTGLNAWEINDIQNNGVGNFAWYSLAPPNPFLLSVLAGTFELVGTLKMSAGVTPATVLQVASGHTLTDSVYRLRFQVVGSDVLVSTQSGSQALCAGGADGQYHTYAIRKSQPGFYGNAEFLYDGVQRMIVSEFAPAGQFISSGALFGTLEGAGTGRSRWHRVEFRLLDDLGLIHCTPAENNSTGGPAEIGAYGSPYTNENFVEITAMNLPTNQFGYLLASSSAGFVPHPSGSQGNLCLGSNIARFVSQVQSSGAGGTFLVPVDLTAIPANPTRAVMPGETWNFQYWYRDQNPAPTSNFTSALRIPFH